MRRQGAACVISVTRTIRRRNDRQPYGFLRRHTADSARDRGDPARHGHDSRRRRARRGAAAGRSPRCSGRGLAARQLRVAGRDQQNGAASASTRSIAPRTSRSVSLLVVPPARRHPYTITSPGGSSASIAAARTKTSIAGWTMPAIRRARTSRSPAPGTGPRRVLHPAAADRRHPLRQHDLGDAVDLDPFLATTPRACGAPVRTRTGVVTPSAWVSERAMSANPNTKSRRPQAHTKKIQFVCLREIFVIFVFSWLG